MSHRSTGSLLLFALSLAIASAVEAREVATLDVAVGPQYDSTHVYLDAKDYDAFVNSFVATFGGKPSARITANVTPTPSQTQMQYVMSPVGILSTFAFVTPIPWPFGQERTGWLVTNMDNALAAARSAGAEVIVDKFRDPIGLDAVIQWPGGVKMQLYWHDKAPKYDPLESVPDTRVYVSPDAADAFLHSFTKFAHAKIVVDDKHADAGEIGRPTEIFRRIQIESGFGKIVVLITDGHLPWPFGHEITGYEVRNLDETLTKAQANGAKIVSPRFDGDNRSSAMLEFPGGYIAEIHAARTRP